MKLKTRLILLVLLVSWVPLGLVSGLLSWRAETKFEENYQEQQEVLLNAVSSEISRSVTRIDQALSGAAQGVFFREELLQHLERGRFYGDSERERKVLMEARRLTNDADLQTLRLVDVSNSGRLIAVGHSGPDDGADSGLVAWALGEPGRAQFLRDRIEREGRVESVWTLQVVRMLGDRVALIGGRILSPDWLEALHRASMYGSEAALEDLKGERVVATFDAEPSGETHDHHSQALSGGVGGADIGMLRLYVDRAPLLEAAQARWYTALVVALISASLALLVAWWTSRRLTRPLERLVLAAGSIATGARDAHLPEVSGNDEVAELTEAFNMMIEDLSESENLLRDAERVAAWRDIAQGIAHELLNPLSPVKMSIETLQKVHERRHPDFEEIFEESTQTILEEVERMRRIVTEFRNFARLPQPKLEEVELAGILRSVVQLHRDLVPGVELRWEGAQEVPLLADAHQMTAVATNLVKNALEAHGPEPEVGAFVKVTLAAPDARGVRWSVSDNGCGMSDEVKAKLFTPYYTNKERGTGLGLAITQRHIIEHGGRIHVRTQRGKGTSFEVHLPPRLLI